MLGWEYPPHIAGGLGTACKGLTSALSAHGVDIHFVVPQMFGGEEAHHMSLTDSKGLASTSESSDPSGVGAVAQTTQVPAFLQPYWNQRAFDEAVSTLKAETVPSIPTALRDNPIVKAIVEGSIYGVTLESVLP